MRCWTTNSECYISVLSLATGLQALTEVKALCGGTQNTSHWVHLCIPTRRRGRQTQVSVHISAHLFPQRWSSELHNALNMQSKMKPHPSLLMQSNEKLYQKYWFYTNEGRYCNHTQIGLSCHWWLGNIPSLNTNALQARVGYTRTAIQWTNKKGILQLVTHTLLST